MSTPRKYSLWFRPSGEIASSLKRRIRELSEEYNSPAFEPHLTLLGGLKGDEEDLVQKTISLASLLKPFDIVLTKAGYRDRYFQSLFVHVQESEELKNARQKAEQLFGKSGGEYMPHLSLMYGDFTQEQKERILNRMGREFHMRFTADSLLLIQTQGEPDRWKKSHTVKLDHMP